MNILFLLIFCSKSWVALPKQGPLESLKPRLLKGPWLASSGPISCLWENKTHNLTLGDEEKEGKEGWTYQGCLHRTRRLCGLGGPNL